MSYRDRQGTPPRGRDGGTSPRFDPYEEPEADEFDLPTWGTPSRSSDSGRRSTAQPSRSSRPTPQSESYDDEPQPRPRSSTTSSFRTRTGEMPSLGDALRPSGSTGSRSTRRADYADLGDDDDGDRYAPPREETYSRSRRTPPRSRQTESYEPDWDESAAYDSDEGTSALPPSRSRPRRSGSGGQRSRRSHERQAPDFGALTAVFAQAGHQERNIATLIVLGLLSTILMSATLAARISGIVDWFPIHLNAAGVPDSYGTATTLWRIPVLAMMSTIVSGVLAWVTARREPLGVTIAFVAVVLLQVICWVALASLAW